MFSAFRSRISSLHCKSALKTDQQNKSSNNNSTDQHKRKSTGFFNNLWEALTFKPDFTNLEEYIFNCKPLNSMNSVTDDFTPIELHFVGIRDPISISQKIAEFEKLFAKAQELHLFEKQVTHISDDEEKKIENENNDNEEKSNEEKGNEEEKEQNNKKADKIKEEEFRDYWPVLQQIFSQGTDIDNDLLAELLDEEKKDNESIDDMEHIENGEISFKTLDKLYLTTTVGDLKKRLREEFDIPEYCHILLIYSHIILGDDQQPLKYYCIDNNSFIVIGITDEKYWKSEGQPEPLPESHGQLSLEAVILRHVARVTGGPVPVSVPVPVLVLKPKPKIQSYDNLLSEIESFSLQMMSDLDILTIEKNDRCIRMPCGHGMVQETLVQYCKMQFKDKNAIIKCPHMIKVEVEKNENEETKNETPEMKEIQCNKEWNYPIIRRVIMACMEIEEKTDISGTMMQQKVKDTMKLELFVARNIAQEFYDIQKCGKCSSIIYQSKQTMKDVIFQIACPLCTEDNKRVAFHKFEEAMVLCEKEMPEFDDENYVDYSDNIESKEDIEVKPTMKEIFLQGLQKKRDLFEADLNSETNHYSLSFCWGCGIIWCDMASLACGNRQCSSAYRAQIVELLAEASVKTIGSVASVPLTRACVNCCQLIQHTSGCKHMKCRQCKKRFCFVCLKPKLKGSGWQCGNSSTVCPVAARQGVECLPSAKQLTFKLY